MIHFEVDDMTCGHCAATVCKAVAAVDIGAKVEVEVGRRLVKVRPSVSDAARIGAAIREAGYTPRLMEPVAAAPEERARAGDSCLSPSATARGPRDPAA